MIKPKWIKKGSDKFPKGDWFVEFFTKGEFHAHQIKKCLEAYKTEFQTATLVQTYSFGKVLIIDRETQSSEVDEFIYHESLVIPSIIYHKKPRRFLILGGGEGATLREVLNYKKTEKVIMVDIDHNIIKFAKKYLYSWHRGSFDNKKTILLIQDARKFIENSKIKFDIIYSDLPSPIEGGPAYRLYTLEFYKKLKERLNSNGIFAMQAGPGQIFQLELTGALINTLSCVFKNVKVYSFFIPSYDIPWNYIMTSDNNFSKKQQEIKKIINNYFIKKPKLIDEKVIEGLFNIPLYMRKNFEKNKQKITEKKPLFFSTSRY